MQTAIIESYIIISVNNCRQVWQFIVYKFGMNGIIKGEANEKNSGY